MSKLVAHGAMLRCSQGMAPSSLSVLPRRSTAAGEKLVAVVTDFAPNVNVAPFGMCRSLANPQVAAATAAAFGALTPQPCVPVVTAPWAPGAAVAMVDEVPALTSDSTCMCAWAGTIAVSEPGSMVDVD